MKQIKSKSDIVNLLDLHVCYGVAYIAENGDLDFEYKEATLDFLDELKSCDTVSVVNSSEVDPMIAYAIFDNIIANWYGGEAVDHSLEEVANYDFIVGEWADGRSVYIMLNEKVL